MVVMSSLGRVDAQQDCSAQYQYVSGALYSFGAFVFPLSRTARTDRST